jgi:hypothetical protein
VKAKIGKYVFVATVIGIAASIGLIVPAARGGDSNTPSSIELTEEQALAWGSDGTRGVLSDELGRFFGEATGEDYVFIEDRSLRQADGKFLLADQARVPLFSLASIKTALPEGRYIYRAFVHRVPETELFLMTDGSNTILAAAFADLLSVKNDGRVIAAVPRVTVFYRTAPYIELRKAAVNVMTQWYKSTKSPEYMDPNFKIRVFEKKLSEKKSLVGQ